MEPIVALATPWGVGALHVIRISGDNSRNIVEAFLDKPLSRPRHASLRFFHSKKVEDQVIAIWYPEPHSYTGEEMVEIMCHGNPAIAELIIESLLDAGMKPAQPGEFTFRAFLHGKMDLTQAEAVNDLIMARSTELLKAGENTLKGKLSTEIADLRDKVLNVLAFLQAAMDFPEDVEESSIEAQLEEILVETEELVKNTRTAEVLRKGINLVIAGRPNVGKSSLMNALVGMERSIVSQIPGTTRDYVEQYTVLGKIPVNVVDTAGLRHTDDPIEQEGVKLALSRIAEADLVIFLYDASLGWTEEDQQMLNLVQEEKTIVVGNKIDKGKAPNQHPKAYFISAKEKTGLEKLIEAIHQVMNVTEPPKLLVSQRQMGLLEKTLNDIRDALEHLSVYAEVAADDLFSSLRHLTALTSGDVEEDLLYTVFSNFCIGK
ncbi:MAG TPA: tRNA uridine-5-carboxymethylaminomethyl(34) synthesis GTPase MnmE [Coprothermobacter proteolyticus]|nr:tRNA uridine-5-carboxymethylaminomethyl(34) synthesis GTPase MnmE [Coprothermobacter proteolyticus]